MTGEGSGSGFARSSFSRATSGSSSSSSTGASTFAAAAGSARGSSELTRGERAYDADGGRADWNAPAVTVPGLRGCAAAAVDVCGCTGGGATRATGAAAACIGSAALASSLTDDRDSLRAIAAPSAPNPLRDGGRDVETGGEASGAGIDAVGGGTDTSAGRVGGASRARTSAEYACASVCAGAIGRGTAVGAAVDCRDSIGLRCGCGGGAAGAGDDATTGDDATAADC